MNIHELSINRPNNWRQPLLGLELEVESCPRPRRVFHDGTSLGDLEFLVEGDGSLRNNGAEFITMPAVFEQYDAGVRELYDRMLHNNATFSPRCGTHVHRNVLPLSVEQFGAVLCAYCLVEPLFMDVCGPDREENIYCVPLYRTPSMLKGFDASSENLLGHKLAVLSPSEWCKYSSLNLLAVRRLGTIEFRMAPAWDNADDMLRWIKLVDDFVKKASEFSSALAVWRAASSDLFGLLERVWPEFEPGRFDEYEWRMNDVDSWAPALNLVRTNLAESTSGEWRFNRLDSPIGPESELDGPMTGRTRGPGRLRDIAEPTPDPEDMEEPPLTQEQMDRLLDRALRRERSSVNAEWPPLGSLSPYSNHFNGGT